MNKLASLIVVVAIAAIALIAAPESVAAPGTSVSVSTNGTIISPTNTPIKFGQQGIVLEGNLRVLAIASNSVSVLSGPIYSNAPNGSLCLTTNGQMWLKSNAVWVAK